MPVIRSVATALPPHTLPQEQIRDLARQHFAPVFSEIDRYMSVFRLAQIDRRHFVAPLEWFAQPRSFKECNDLFIDAATALGAAAARRCLDAAGLEPADVEHLIWVSTTGMAAPSPDALLINRLGMQRHTRRTPIWGLGCVTFQWNDLSKRNLIAASLFADGVAAVLVEGDQARGLRLGARKETQVSSLKSQVSILGTQSTLWPNSTDVMGWDIVDSGMQVVFSSRIP